VLQEVFAVEMTTVTMVRQLRRGRSGREMHVFQVLEPCCAARTVTTPC